MSKYELVILTDRGRGDSGEWGEHIFEAENDLEALINVSYMYDPQGKSQKGLDCEEDEEQKYYNQLRQLYSENKENAISLAKSLLECEDPSDYYDNIAYLKNLETHENIFEDQYFISAYEEDMYYESDEDDEDDEDNDEDNDEEY